MRDIALFKQQNLRLQFSALSDSLAFMASGEGNILATREMHDKNDHMASVYDPV